MVAGGGGGGGGEVTDCRLLRGSAVWRVLPEAITARRPGEAVVGGWWWWIVFEAEPLRQINGVISVHGVAAQTKGPPGGAEQFRAPAAPQPIVYPAALFRWVIPPLFWC